ncbi:hypothetical protein ABZ905_32205 [Streptomyces parvus]|uniref:hypothetical protein n=1 Tax=Streptomyces parvus TaxID=66428 RepID=UPI003408AEBB
MPSKTPVDPESPVTQAEFQRFQKLVAWYSLAMAGAIGLLCLFTVALSFEG